jgi:Arc/MetJ-type ribon-helix-helix transcriptional regulator
MTIHLPEELENSVKAAVKSGHFSSLDEAMTKAARLLVSELRSRQSHPDTLPQGEITPDPVLGCLRDDAELIDEIVADAYRKRREETWREIDL